MLVTGRAGADGDPRISTWKGRRKGIALLETPLVAIIDDDEEVRSSLGSLIESFGYRTKLFVHADAFLAMAQPGPFACIISDIHMPGTNGIQLAARLAQLPSPPPLVLITAYVSPAVERQAKEAGVLDVATKPLDPVALERLLRRIL
jgi:two-component system response regulator FixJ